MLDQLSLFVKNPDDFTVFYKKQIKSVSPVEKQKVTNYWQTNGIIKMTLW